MKINAPMALRILTKFIREEIEKLGFRRGIIGLSGGLDSTVAAYLAQRALGKENLIGMIMPYRGTFGRDVEDARDIARRLGIASHEIDISPMIDAYYQRHPTESRILKGNKMARERMSILYDYSEREKALILGTSNKTELLLGYGTIHGDTACAINPMGDLYKTQVRQLAGHLEVPENILNKAPTAGLWPDQTDEDELGLDYATIDAVLFHMVDKRRTRDEITAMGFKAEVIDRIMDMIDKSEFKRHLPPIPKLSERTIGHDFIYPFDRGR